MEPTWAEQSNYEGGEEKPVVFRAEGAKGGGSMVAGRGSGGQWWRERGVSGVN